MAKFYFYHPVFVRYGDLDPQGHVNNARYLTYLENARVAYLKHLDLWDGKSFLEVGIILASINLDFKAPIIMAHDIRVGVRVSRLGRKSLDMDYLIEEKNTRQCFAAGSTVLVAYDYQEHKTIPIPGAWRETISTFEQIDPGTPHPGEED